MDSGAPALSDVLPGARTLDAAAPADTAGDEARGAVELALTTGDARPDTRRTLDASAPSDAASDEAHDAVELAAAATGSEQAGSGGGRLPKADAVAAAAEAAPEAEADTEVEAAAAAADAAVSAPPEPAAAPTDEIDDDAEAPETTVAALAGSDGRGGLPAVGA